MSDKNNKDSRVKRYLRKGMGILILFLVVYLIVWIRSPQLNPLDVLDVMIGGIKYVGIIIVVIVLIAATVVGAILLIDDGDDGSGGAGGA